MNAFLLGIFGLFAGIMFGLMVGYGFIGALGIIIGMLILLVGAFVPTPFRAFFGTAVLGFLLSWMVYGGLELL